MNRALGTKQTLEAEQQNITGKSGQCITKSKKNKLQNVFSNSWNSKSLKSYQA